MAAYQPLQSSFAYGEISPRLRGRSNTERYSQSVEECENTLTFSHGNFIKRPGTKFLEESTSTGSIRLIPVQLDLLTPYVVELGFKSGAGYIRLLDRDGYVEDPASPGNPWEAATPWPDSHIPHISFAQSTVTNTVYFACDSSPPQRLIIDPVTPAYTFQAVPFTFTPTKWAANDYPHEVTFHQQRLWFAASPSYPDTLWASKPNSFLDFNPGTAAPADGIEFEMSDRVTIEWIRGSRDLLIGADFGEYILQAEGGVLIPADIEARRQSSYGSAHHHPGDLGNGVLYLGNDRRRIRFMNYQFLEEGWVSLDITWPSEHITEPLVKEIHFTYAPDPFLWALLDNGTMVSAVYEREQDNMVGWHRHPFPGATVKSAAITKTESATELWIAAERVINSVTKTYIERTDVPKDPENSTYFADSSITGTVVDAGGGVFTVAVPHLEAETVQVEVEGAMHIDCTVASGIITLQEGFEGSGAGAQVKIGLKYTSKVVTLPLEGMNPSGTAQSLLKRYNRIFLRLLNSTIPVINGDQPPARTPDVSMGSSPGLFSGDVKIHNIGRDRFAKVTIEMPLPKPYNIISLFGDAGTGKL